MRPIRGWLLVSVLFALLVPASASAGTWGVQPAAVSPAPGNLEGVSCASATSCKAVGDTTGPEGPSALVQSWDGHTWTLDDPRVASGAEYSWLRGVSCVSASWCAAAGSYESYAGSDHRPLIDLWNGSGWTSQLLPLPSGAEAADLNSVSCATTTDCLAVGTQENGSGTQTPLVEQWNGSGWAPSSTPADGVAGRVLTGVSCPDAGDCMVVGADFDNGAAQPFSEQLQSSTWSVQSVPSSGIPLAGVSCSSASACTAVGGWLPWSTTAPDGPDLTDNFAVRWDGAHWVQQATYNPARQGTNYFSLSAVSCPTSSSCTAVGESGGTSGSASAVQSWNGTSWTDQDAPHDQNLSGVSCPTITSCFAVGASPHGGTMPYIVATPWQTPQYTVTVSKGDVGSGTVTSQPAGINCGTTCSINVGLQSTLTLQAQPDPGSSFELWGSYNAQQSCSPSPTQSTCTFDAIHGDITIVADFGRQTSAGTAPASASRPAITGAPLVGRTLHVSNGTWTGDPVLAYTYQWQRCGTTTCVNIPGATRSTYRLTTRDWGSLIRVAVGAINLSGSATGSSRAIGPAGPSRRAIAASLFKQLLPHGAQARIGTLLHSHGERLAFNIPLAGRAAIVWSARVHGRTIRLAGGSLGIPGPGHELVHLDLTPPGVRILSHSRRLTIIASFTLGPAGARPIHVRRTFSLIS